MFIFKEISVLLDHLQPAIISHVVSPSEFYLVIDDERQKALDELYSTLNKMYLDEYLEDSSKFNPLLNDEGELENRFVAVYCDEETEFQRGYVTNIVPENEKPYQVFLLDFGTSDEYCFEDLVSLDAAFYEHVPFQAIRCRLYGVQAPENNSTWPEQASKLFPRSCLIKCRDVIKEEGQMYHLVEVFATNNELGSEENKPQPSLFTSLDPVNLNHYLIKQALARISTGEEKVQGDQEKA